MSKCLRQRIQNVFVTAASTRRKSDDDARLLVGVEGVGFPIWSPSVGIGLWGGGCGVGVAVGAKHGFGCEGGIGDGGEDGDGLGVGFVTLGAASKTNK